MTTDELREHATAVILNRARLVDPSEVSELLDEIVMLTGAEIDDVVELVQTATITVEFPDGAGR